MPRVVAELAGKLGARGRSPLRHPIGFKGVLGVHAGVTDAALLFGAISRGQCQGRNYDFF